MIYYNLHCFKYSAMTKNFPKVASCVGLTLILNKKGQFMFPLVFVSNNYIIRKLNITSIMNFILHR